MKIALGTSLAVLAFCSTAMAQPVAVTSESLVLDAKRAAGTDFPGTFTRICVAPQNAMPNARPPGAAATPRSTPDRATWYAEPYKAFDNLVWLGTKAHSSWALTTSQGIILIDTNYNYAIEAEIVDGLKKVGLNPADIKYVIISHAHGDHDEGAKLLQDRYGAKIVMGAADWDATEKATNKTGGSAKRDIVGTDGMKITLGDTSVTLVPTPGHTPGTLSAIFPVKDKGRTLTVAYSGGTAFNFPRAAENFAIYEASQKKMAKAAADAGATVLMSNHTEFDGAYDKVRLAQLPRKPGEPHPYEVGAAAIQRYFTMTAACAQSQRLMLVKP